MRRWWTSLFGLACVVASTGAPAQMQRVADCTSLSIHLAGIPEAAGARCQGDENRGNELIDASGPGRVFVVRHQTSSGHDYLQREEITRIVRKLTAAATLDGVSERYKFGHFDIARYQAAANAVARPAKCFAFVSYAGHVAQTTGYRHAIIGSYCDLSGKEPDDARIVELLRAISADFW
jgi:hypothetical protein